MTRKDAAHNRRHIVTVARHAFAEDGLDLPVREVARRAGLGVATLYRHFPSRPDLVGAVLADEVARCETEVREALDDPDAWRALSTTIRRFAERQVLDRGLNEALLGSHTAGLAFADQRRDHAQALEHLVDRARAAGHLRAGVTVQDVRVGLRAIASFRAPTPQSAAPAIERLTNLLLAGLAGSAQEH